MTSVEKEIVKQEKQFQPSQDVGGDLPLPTMSPSSARIVYKSIYTTQHISMKLGPNLVLKFLSS